MAVEETKEQAANSEITKVVLSAIEKVKFGQVVIKIQDGNVVQIDSIERRRIGKFQRCKEDQLEYFI